MEMDLTCKEAANWRFLYFLKITLALDKNICKNTHRSASVAQLARAQPCQG